MTFKNWIPRQIDVRFGEFRFDQSHNSHEYGRFRMFAKALSANYVQAFVRLLPFTSNLLSKEDIIKRAKDVYKEKQAEARFLGSYNKETFISEGEFVERFIQGTEATFAEFRTILMFFVLLFSGIAAGDDDDDPETKSVKSLVRRQMDKLSDEVGFFYNPKSFIDILGTGAPVFSIVRDSYSLINHSVKNFFGFGLEQIGWDEKGIEMQESAKPVKYLFKTLPVLKEILTYLPAFDQETAKEWGVRINDRRGF